MRVAVTVGVCLRDCEASVGEAVESVLSQDFPHELMELVVVDGCSEDRTLAIVEESLSRTDIRSRVFRENEGLGAARQMVVDNATGDYVVWVDGDVSLTSSYVREMVEFMEKNPRVGVARGTERFKGSSSIAVLESVRDLVDRSRKSKRFLVGAGGAIQRLEAIRQAGGFDRGIRGAMEDVDMGVRVQSLGWVMGLGDPVFYHRLRQTWRSLWQEYFWWGYGAHFVRHKHGKRAISIGYELPPVAFVVGVAHIVHGYRLTRKKVSVLVPVHYLFKQVAWCLGYVHGHLDGYGHAQA
jgi:glycosyltransferase involved in cell wall biosynthesis